MIAISDRGPSPALLYAALGGALVLGYVLLQDHAVAQAILYCSIALMSVGAVVLGGLQHPGRPSRRRALIAVGLGSWAAGDIAWFLTDVNGNAPYPSAADGLYLAGYPVLAAGLLSIALAGRGRKARLADLVDIAIVTSCAGLVAWPFVFKPILEPGWGAATFVSTAYAGGDVVLFGMVAALFLNSHSRTRAVALLAAGVSAFTFADVMFYVPSFATSASIDSWSSNAYLLGYVLIGASGLARQQRTEAAVPGRRPGSAARRTAVVGATLLALPGAMTLDAILGDGFNPGDWKPLAVGSCLVIGLVVVRAWLLVRATEESRDKHDQDRMRLQTVFESAGLGIIISGNELMTETNRAFQEMVGYCRSELATIRYQDIVHPDDLEDVRGFVERGPGALELRERRYVHRDGSTVLCRATFTTAADGRLHIGVIEDITERTQLERQLQGVQRLEAVGRLAAGIAHDFNNLLTASMGHAELIRTARTPEERDESVDVILEAGARASALTAQLLTFSRQQEFRAEEIDTRELMTRTTDLLRRVLGGSYRIEARIEDDAAAIVADPSQIDQVLMNLALNARDAMPDGGVLSLSASAFANDGSATRYAGVPPGEYCRILVSDTGTGMDEDTLAHALEPYFTTKEAGKGTGLGLATTDGIIARAGGHLLVSSVVGRGTTFEILLPKRSLPASA